VSTGGGAPTEEELRAAYEAELKRVRVEHLLLEHVVTMVNLGMRRTGLAPGTEDERDREQVRLAIESVRALTPLLEQTAPSQMAQIRSALSQLQLAFVRIGGSPAAGEPAGEPAGAAASAGPGGSSEGQGAGSEGPGDGSEGPYGGAESPGGGGPGAPSGGAEQGGPGPGQGAGQGQREPGPAQRSGRLWVPGQ